jgi:hypothetical protein
MNSATATGARPAIDRLVLGFLLALMAVGSLALWTVVPLAALWAVSLVDGSAAGHLLLALFAVPAAIILFGAVLARLNVVYVRVAAAASRSAGDHDREAYSRGPLEWLIVGSLVIALVALVAWMVFVAEDPFPWTPPTA